MKIFPVLNSALVLLSGIKTKHGRVNTKIVLELVRESRKSKNPVKVMTSKKRTMEQTRSIFGVGEKGGASGKRDLGVEKRLDGAIDKIGVKGAFVIVSRVLLTSLRNWSGSIPEKISSDKLPRGNARSATG